MQHWLYFAATKINPSDIGYDAKIGPKGGKSADAAVGDILELVYFIAGIAAVLVIVIAGFIFVTSRGKPELITQARMAIIAAVAGLVIIFSAFVITQLVIGRLEG